MNNERIHLSDDEVFRKFFDLAVDLFVVIDSGGHVVKFNRAWENLLGYTSNEMVGEVFIQFVHPDDHDRTMAAFEYLFKKGELTDFTNRYVTRAGDIMFIEWRAFVEGDLVFCVARDVTKRVETESELKKSRETYQFITENMSDVIWVMDPFTMEFTYMSPSVERLRGFTVEEVLQQTMEELVTPQSGQLIASVIAEGLQNYIITGETYEATTRVEHPVKGGGTVWTEVVSRLLKDSAGNLRVLGVTRNITQNLKMENELKKKNTELQLANNTRNKLLSVISHDLRSPFHPILNMTDILITDLDILSEEEIKKFAGDIHRSAEKVMNLLENLLKWTRVQAGALRFNPVRVDLHFLIKESANSLKLGFQAKNLQVIINSSPGITLYGDISMLRSLFQNLLSNAMKFSYPGGKVEISITDDGESAKLTVRDHGVGMSEEQKAKLFLEHEITSTPGTSNEKGSGLGLSLCFEFAAKHKGTIEVESEPGVGTIFIVNLPK